MNSFAVYDDSQLGADDLADIFQVRCVDECPEGEIRGLRPLDGQYCIENAGERGSIFPANTFNDNVRDMYIPEFWQNTHDCDNWEGQNVGWICEDR
eukprot:UN06077